MRFPSLPALPQVRSHFHQHGAVAVCVPVTETRKTADNEDNFSFYLSLERMMGWLKSRFHSRSLGEQIGLLVALAVAFAIVSTSALLWQLFRAERFYGNVLGNDVADLQKVRLMQVTFKKEVQEWKDILLRGSDPGMLRQYRDNFHREQSQVNRTANDLVQSLTNSEERQTVLAFSQAHAQLDAAYETALVRFEQNGGKDFHAADASVKGMDRPPTDLLDRAVAHISDRIASVQTVHQAGLKTKRTITLILLGCGLAVLIWISTVLVIDLRKRIVDLTLAARKVASGDLTVDVAGSGEEEFEIAELARSFAAMVSYLREMAAVSEAIAGGDLVQKVEPRSERDTLGNAFAGMTKGLGTLVRDVRGATSAVHSGASTIAESVQSLSATSSELSASVAEITSTMEELSASSSQISEHSASVAEIANDTWESSKKGVDTMEVLTAKMAHIRDENQNSLNEIIGLGQTSKEISKVMTIINTIADQTKLIAFNAALEAASAGESGKRFGVVAAEIRRLADNVTDSTGEIESKITEIQNAINRLVITSESGAHGIADGMTVTSETAERLKELVGAAKRTASAAQQISLSTQQQKTAANQVVVALREIVGAANHSAQSMSQLSHVSQNLAGLSSNLDTQVDRFRVPSASAEAL